MSLRAVLVCFAVLPLFCPGLFAEEVKPKAETKATVDQKPKTEEKPKAEDKPKSEDKKKGDEEGFISLFNGKDLAGWKNAENGQFKVENGELVVSGPRAHLFTDKEFTNFIFRAEVKTTPGSNSGIFFHTKFQETGWPAVGYESQVNVTHRDPVKTGSLYNVVKLFETPAKDDEWWTQEITVKGKQITIKINGEAVIDYTEKESDIAGDRKLSKGSFAIQAHDPNSVVYYRNIRVKPLED